MANDSRPIKLSHKDEQRAELLYGRKWRQLRRWLERGEQNHDPCPLFDPGKMPAWWGRNYHWRVPAEMEAAAIAAARPAEKIISPPAASPQPATAAATEATGIAPPEPPRPINLADYDPEEGDRLRELQQIQAAKFDELREKLRRGSSDSVLAVDKYLKLSEGIDKIATRAEERLKKRGLYILRESVDREAAAIAELLRQGGESIEKRVLERCASLGPAERREVAAGVNVAWSSFSRILARLTSFDHSEDLLQELAAA